MADPVSLAIRTEQAINRLEKRFAVLAERAGVTVPEIPRRNHDTEMLRALQIEAIADGIDALLKADWPSPQTLGEPVTDEEAAGLPPAETETTEAPEDYSGWIKANLVLELNQRKIDLESIEGTGANGNVLVEDLRAALKADDEAKAAKDEDETP